VEKDRSGRGDVRDRMAESTGDEAAGVKHEGWVTQYLRAKAEVSELHWWAARAAGRRAIGMALLMAKGRAAVALRDWARGGL
jgi:hypothetical protein